MPLDQCATVIDDMRKQALREIESKADEGVWGVIDYQQEISILMLRVEVCAEEERKVEYCAEEESRLEFYAEEERKVEVCAEEERKVEYCAEEVRKVE